jgi:hypothetical protein
LRSNSLLISLVFQDNRSVSDVASEADFFRKDERKSGQNSGRYTGNFVYERINEYAIIKFPGYGSCRKDSEMTYYRYNASDIAAYFKWTSMPAQTEYVYLDILFQMREQILARPQSKDFESFVQTVYREMYHIWARGFENEFSDIHLITPEDAVSLFCDQEYIALESYMKLISLHLILTENLPYVRINFVGLPLIIGVDGAFSTFEKNLAEAVRMLRLDARDDIGNEYDLTLGIPNETLCIGLQQEYRKVLFGHAGYRLKRNIDYHEKMRLLQEKSTREYEAQKIISAASNDSKRRNDHKEKVK